MDDAFHGREGQVGSRGDQLRAAGLNVLYSDEIVTPELRVEREPVAAGGVELLSELLAPHGLRAEAVAEGVWAVVPAPGKPEAAASGAATAAPVPLAEVIVAASRYSLASDTPDPHVLVTRAELDSLPRLAEESLKAVHRLPGASSNGVSGLAHIRGGEENETLVLFDGLPLHEPFHFRNFLSPMSLLSARIVEGIDVHAGGFTANYGDRMSAIIDGNSVHPEADRSYELGLSLFHTSGLAAQRFDDGRGQWMLAGRRSNLHEVASLLESDLGEPSYYDVFARADYAISPSTHVSVDFLLANDRIEISDVSHGEQVDAAYGNAYLWATLTQEWSESLRGRLLGSFSRVNQDRTGTVEEPGLRAGQVDDRRDYHVTGLQGDLSWSTARWLHRAGFDLRDVAARYRYSSAITYSDTYPYPGYAGTTVQRQLAPEPEGHHVALYASSRFRATDRLTVEAGMRWDMQSFTGVDADEQLVPRANLLYEFDARTRLRASWGRFQQFQDINELQVEDGIDTFYPSQQSTHTILSLERDLAAGFGLRIEAYRKAYSGLRPRYENLLDPVSLLPELDSDRVRVAPDSALAEGIELLLTRRDAGPWSGWLSYAWSRVTDRLDGTDVLRSWDQTQTLNAGVNWSKEGWNLTAAGTWHTGWPTTPASLGEAQDGAAYIDLGPRNSARLGHFASVDLRASRSFRLAHGELDLFAELTNALDRRNPCCVSYSIGGSPDGGNLLESRVEHWLPRIPSIGVLWTF